MSPAVKTFLAFGTSITQKRERSEEALQIRSLEISLIETSISGPSDNASRCSVVQNETLPLILAVSRVT